MKSNNYEAKSASLKVTSVMPKKIIIHSGMHKTGSSAIQHFLQQSPPLSLGFSRNRSNSSALVRQLVARSDWYTDKRVDLEKELVSLIRQKPELHILSSEFISAASPEELDTILNYFLDQYDRVHHFCYVRDPFSLASSMWQQRLKGLPLIDKSTKALDKFKIYNTRYLSLTYLSYFKHPRYSTQVRLFDEVLRNTGSVVKDFSAEFNLDPLINSMPMEEHINTSISQNAASFLYKLRKSSHFLFTMNKINGSSQLWNKLVNAVISYDNGPKLRFSKKLVLELVDPSSILEYKKLLGYYFIKHEGMLDTTYLKTDDTINSFEDLLRPNSEYFDGFLCSLGRHDIKFRDKILMLLGDIRTYI
jgi:hypothetical protein